MRVVVVGQGGREHAIAWRLAIEGHEIVSVPGNPGMARLGACVTPADSGVEALAQACLDASPSLVVVGPEAQLAAGLADRLRAASVPVFGPDAAAAKVEASKAFAKEIMAAANVPTARFQNATTEMQAAEAIASFGGRVVVKADGLAAGKGVVVCDSEEEARSAARQWLAKGPVVVEERLEGPELSVIGLCDGVRTAVLPAARDHKRLLDGGRGPNTGGMGAVCPVPLDAGALEEIRDTVLAPTLATLARRGTPFVGALYAGLMLTKDGPRVLEFNARLGDPETQALLVALDRSAPLGELFLAAARGRLDDAMLSTDAAACCVVLASAGYPASSRSGDVIEGVDAAEASGAVVFHAGTRVRDGRLETAGGRVLGVVKRAPDLARAREGALEAARLVRFDGVQMRTDIGATTAG